MIYSTNSLQFPTFVYRVPQPNYNTRRTDVIEIADNLGFYRYYRIVFDGTESLSNISVQEWLLYGIQEVITTTYR